MVWRSAFGSGLVYGVSRYRAVVYLGPSASTRNQVAQSAWGDVVKCRVETKPHLERMCFVPPSGVFSPPSVSAPKWAAVRKAAAGKNLESASSLLEFYHDTFHESR